MSLGYSNVASVGNRLRSLKKRYGFPNLDGKTAAGSKSTTNQTTEAANGASANGSMTETTKPAKRGRPARVKNTTTPTTTNGTANGSGSKSSKRKRNDDNDDNDDDGGEDASSGEQQAGPAKKRATRRGKASTPAATARENGSAPAESATTSGKSVHFAPLPNFSKRGKKQAQGPPEVELSPPLDVEALTESVNEMDEPSERLYFVALETVREARRERKLRRETPRSGIKLRFRRTGT